MEFKKPEDIEKGPVWKGESAENKMGKSGESDGETDNSSMGKSSTGETVEFGKTPEDGGMKMSVSEGVELAGEMLAQPETFDIAGLSRVEELEEENEKLRETVEQQSEAIADLAEAVETLSENQADIANMDAPATTMLEADAYGDIYRTNFYAGFGD